jgi:hypothetical protein
MILRRVIEHVREQNWTAIAIDFVIVVLGVFVGLQVSNWNAANADRREIARYLDDIASDVQADFEELSRTEAASRDRIAASAYVLRKAGLTEQVTELAISQSRANDVFSGAERLIIPDLSPPEEEQRNRLWQLAVGVYVYDTNRSAVDALISSGDIDLIDDRRVMNTLREYYYLVNALDQSQTRTIIPLRNHVIEIGIDRGLSPYGVIDEKVLVEKLENDDALVAALAASREYAGFHLLLTSLLEEKAQQLLRLLEEHPS